MTNFNLLVFVITETIAIFVGNSESDLSEYRFSLKIKFLLKFLKNTTSKSKGGFHQFYHQKN
jgi:hypothetical protein